MPIVPRKYTHPIAPRNRGAARVARTAIDRLSPAAAEQFNNTLSVDGFPVIYYRRKSTGLACTCSSSGTSLLPSITDLAAGESSLVQDTDVSSVEQKTINDGSPIIIRRYGSRHSNTTNPSRTDPEDVTQGLNVENHSDDLDDPFTEILDPETLPDDSLGYDASLLLGTGAMGCGVCLGTGFVGGYDPVGAVRFVLDAQTTWQLNGVTNQGGNPNVLESVSQGGRLQFKITLPFGVLSIDRVRLWNNKDAIVDGYSIVCWNGTAWVDTNDVNLIPLAQGLPVTFRVNLDPDLKFTHIELQFNTGVRPIYADWPNLSESVNPALPENFDNAQLALSPYLPNVRVGDVVGESTYERRWVVTNVVNKMDRERRVRGWEVTTRYVQSYEYQSMLFVRVSPHRHTRVQPDVPFRTDSTNTYDPTGSGYNNRDR